MSDIYAFEADSLTGQRMSLSQYRGKVLLIVNTASQCGFTPQYAGLEALYRQWHEKGLEVLGFPCNQFGRQEPGDAAQIGAFCQQNYGVSFPMFDKIEVNGPRAHPLYEWLTRQKRGLLGARIQWNFTKFLLRRDGTAYQRYAPQAKPASLAGDIERLLAESGV